MAPEVVTVIETREHTAVALTEDGEEIILYRGNLQSFQRNPKWDFATISIGTQCRVTIVSSVKPRERRRGIEILILTP